MAGDPGPSRNIVASSPLTPACPCSGDAQRAASGGPGCAGQRRCSGRTWVHRGSGQAAYAGITRVRETRLGALCEWGSSAQGGAARADGQPERFKSVGQTVRFPLHPGLAIFYSPSCPSTRFSLARSLRTGTAEPSPRPPGQGRGPCGRVSPYRCGMGARPQPPGRTRMGFTGTGTAGRPA